MSYQLHPTLLRWRMGHGGVARLLHGEPARLDAPPVLAGAATWEVDYSPACDIAQVRSSSRDAQRAMTRAERRDADALIARLCSPS